ncbi:hypothetical protein [Gallibacterium anatis]|uniref:hypothetical protein n=1 Tax=Gallibacterium anatis TaxID=750 RepID=UPI001B32DEA7|nr:hypothetical protein [Gallibacterium anatis]
MPENTRELKPRYRIQFHLLDDEGKPYQNTPFTIKLVVVHYKFQTKRKPQMGLSKRIANRRD